MLPQPVWASKTLANGLDLFALQKVCKRSPDAHPSPILNGADGVHYFGVLLLILLLDEHIKNL